MLLVQCPTVKVHSIRRRGDAGVLVVRFQLLKSPWLLVGEVCTRRRWAALGTAPSWSWLLAPDHRFEVIPQVAVVHCHKAPNVKRSKLHLVRLLITRVRACLSG
jgi:hypothetical protein